MRPSSYIWLALSFIVGLCAYQGSAQAPPPTADCSAELVSLLPCLDYVEGNVSAPAPSCCAGVGNVVRSNPNCLCALFNNSTLPIQVNSTRALQLPALCGVATPNPPNCGATTPIQPSPTAPATPPSVSTPTQSPPTAPATPPSATASPPVAAPTPSVAPSAPTTPSVAPSIAPTVAPSVAPTVAPSLAPVIAPSASTPTPASGVPGPSPVAETPVATPTSTPAMTPTGSATTPTGSASSPPSPPPSTDENFAAPFVGVSLLSVAIVISSILFLQL